MRIIRFIAEDGHIHHGEPQDNNSAIELTGALEQGFRRTAMRLNIRKLLAPLEPRDIICIGRNYQSATDAAADKRADTTRNDTSVQPSEKVGAQAISESPQQIAEMDHTLEVFLKPSTSIQNPDDPILIPTFESIDPQLDCEGELAIIIGREARNIAESDALQHVFGYTIANDVTARAFQTPTGPPLWMRGKGFDTFCPIGPAIVTADEIPDPNNLAIRTIINGNVVREGNTRHMIRSVPEIIAALSRHMTLRTGAIVLTGAPPLCSAVQSSLHTVRVEIEDIGALQNIEGSLAPRDRPF
jgi:2-keto-4-pentenoate hydratase/2-oxohepta-3-ene-1,7-dioic acid hydratase in catechol pathway